MIAEYGEMTGLEMGALVAKRKLSAVELLEESIRRVEQVNGKLNAVVMKMYEQARLEALAIDSKKSAVSKTAPFRGVPFLLKELGIAYKGMPYRGASKLYYNEIAKYDSELLVRWRAAGLVVYGKTNTPEFGILPTTEPELYGPCHNPWRMGYSTGGSSGGAGAVVAARVVPLAHAGDGGGSIRIPASACGVFGFKPSRARTPAGPEDSEALHGAAIQHVITRSVADSAAALDATTGDEITQIYSIRPPERPFLDEVRKPKKRKLRIAFWTDPLLPADPTNKEVVGAVEETAKLLESLGHHVERARPSYDEPLFANSFFRLFCSAAAGEVLKAGRERGSPVRRDEVELVTWLIALFGRAMTAGEFSLALRDMQATMRIWAHFLTQYDVLLTPTLARTPLLHGTLMPKSIIERAIHEGIAKAELAQVVKLPGVMDRLVKNAYQFAPFTMFANVGGLPSMSVPLHFAQSGLPIGSMFTARHGEDAKLFALAGQLEQARPWADKSPLHVSG